MAVALASSQQVNSAAADFSTLTSTAITVNNGDVLIVKMRESFDNYGDGLSGGGLTWTLGPFFFDGTNLNRVVVWTATVTGNPGTVTVTMTYNGGRAAFHSMVVERWTGGVLAASPVGFSGGVTGFATGTPSVTTAAVSAGSVLTWINEHAGTSSAGSYVSPAAQDATLTTPTPSFWSAWQAVATAGAQTVGMTAPTGQTWSLAGIEILAAVRAPLAGVRRPAIVRASTY